MCRHGAQIILLLSFCLNIEIGSAQLHDKNIFQTVTDYSGRVYTVRMEYDHPYDTLTYIELTPFLNMEEGGVCMSDSIGNLIFYSNGLQINNRDFTMMENGDSMNFTGLNSDWYFFEQLPSKNGFYISSSYSNPIPIPGNSNQYLIVHHPSFFRNDFHFFKTFYSRIDMNQNGGLGAVIEKNIELPGESQCAEFCKHANGIDWWLITADMKSDSFYIFLINKDGIIGPEISLLGSKPDPHDLTSSQIFSFHKLRISPTGTILASVHQFDIDLFNFDRCTGEIIFIKNITIPYETGINLRESKNQLGGCEFSACGNYLFVENSFILYQFDLTKPYSEPIRLSMTYEKQPYITRLPNDKILIYSSEVEGTFFNSFTGLISEPCYPESSSLVNYTLFDDYPVFSPFLKNGKIPNLPNYRLGKKLDIDQDTCKNGFVSGSLQMPEQFMYNGISYNKLFRQFKSN